MALVSERLAFIISADGTQAIKAFEKTGRAAEKELGKAEARIDRLGPGLTRFGAAAVAASGIAAGGLFKLAESAANSQAAIAANEQVLGEASDAVQDWAKNSVEAAGISERAAIEAATSFGQLGKIAGQQGPDLAAFSTRLIQVSADLAAFKDVDPAQVLEDLQSGFAGSTEVLRKYGIFLDDAGLKNAFFEATGQKVVGTLNAQQRIIATNAEILRQSADATGQWARESDGLIAQQAQLRAELDNLGAAIGAGVLPVVNQLVSGLTDAAGAMGELDPAVQEGIGKFATYATGALGVVGSLSLIGGQALKARDRFTTLSADGTRSLNGLGRAAKAAGVTLAAFAAIDIATSAINSGFGVFEKQRESLEALQGTLGDTRVSYEEVIAAFARQTDALDDEIRGFLSLGSTYDQFFKDQISLVEESEASLDTYEKALRNVFDASPAQARAVVDALKEQRDAARDAGEETDDLNRLIGRLNPALNGWEKAAGSVAEANTAVAETATEAADDTEELGDSMKVAAGFAQNLEDRMRSLLDRLDQNEALLDMQEQFEGIEEKADEAFKAAAEGAEDAEQKARDYKRAQNDLKRSVIDYLGTIGQVPSDVVTEILADIDDGSVAEAEAAITKLIRDRQVIIRAATSGYNPAAPASTRSNNNNISGGREHGGSVRAGEQYLVGERGPEIFRAPGSGFIYPNGSSFGGDPGIARTLTNIERILTTSTNRPLVGNVYVQPGRPLLEELAEVSMLYPSAA